MKTIACILIMLVALLFYFDIPRGIIEVNADYQELKQEQKQRLKDNKEGIICGDTGCIPHKSTGTSGDTCQIGMEGCEWMKEE